MNYQLYAPGVNLFVFQIRESSILMTDDNSNVNLLWETCNNIISTLNKNFQLLDWLDLKKQPNYHYVNLIKASKNKNNTRNNDDFLIPNSISIEGEIDLDKEQTLVIKGFVYPVRIFNSYGLWLNLHRPETENGEKTKAIDIELLNKLNLHQYFVVVKNKPSLSQTLLITASLTPEIQREFQGKGQQALRSFADEYLKLFFPDSDTLPPCNRVGYLFGSPIFQYGLITELPTSGTIYVWFFYSKTAQNILREYHQDIFELFFYRNEATQAYQEIQNIINNTLVEQYANIKSIIEDLDKQQKYLGNSQKMLDKLRVQTRQLPTMARSYDETLTKIINLQSKIEIATQKYNETIDRFDGRIKKRHYKFLENFSRNSSPYVQANIKAKIRTFQYGSNLIDKTLVSIRGIVEIEQTELEKQRQKVEKEWERQLEINVFAAGSGIAVGGIVSTSYSATVNKNNPLPKPFYVTNIPLVAQSIFWSLLFSILVAAGLMWSLGKFFRKPDDN
ncbi:MAG: hypothetical protein KME64_06535 [Scytonematopsis contorta HA4267-MV1]|jgi:hypothetical protein|nr:hypothetical protein [Scytonematopsis contorta HA4267-MV1]